MPTAAVTVATTASFCPQAPQTVFVVLEKHSNMAQVEETTSLHFSCLCRKVTGSANVPVAKLPLPYSLCHCNICRHQTGLLCASYATLPKDSTDVTFKGPLKRYNASNIVTRFFCSHCGANVYLQDSREPGFDICTGALDRADGVIELRNHIFVPDTKDGGFSQWLPEIPAWEEFSQSKQWVIRERKQSTNASDKEAELLAFCQCKGVQFKITPPNEDSNYPSSPSPELLENDATSHVSTSGTSNKWWLCAGGQKYLAGTCACHSCRLSAGFDIQAWAFIPKANILHVNGDPLNFRADSLAQYESSKGVYRHFCFTCGATIFWRGDNRPEVVDVSVGLLDAEEGSRAENWLQWQTSRVSFEEEGQNKDLISKLAAGLKQWGMADSAGAAAKHVKNQTP